MSGRLVRVILVTVVCDKPAAHKVGGFASHSHTNFCTLCWITLSDKTTPAAFQEGGMFLNVTHLSLLFRFGFSVAFRMRTNEEQRELGDRY